MDQPAAQLEQVIRLGLFFGLFIAFAAAEYFWPRKTLTRARPSRWVPTTAFAARTTVKAADSVMDANAGEANLPMSSLGLPTHREG